MNKGKRILISVFATFVGAVVEGALLSFFEKKAKGKEK